MSAQTSARERRVREDSEPLPELTTALGGVGEDGRVSELTAEGAMTHWTPEEHDQAECGAGVDAPQGTVMYGTLNPERVTCPACVRLLGDWEIPGWLSAHLG